MKAKRERDRADDQLDRLARTGRTWGHEVALRRARAMKAWETRRRRARGEPDPPKVPKRSHHPAIVWVAPDGRIAMTNSYRPSFVREVHELFAGAWWDTSLCAWLVDRRHVRKVVGLMRRYYASVSIDLEVARLIGFLVFEPQGPDGEEAAA